jgi:RNase P subunit RPR2
VDILERGKPPDARSYIARCDRCRSLVRFRRAEAECRDDPREAGTVSVACPVCGDGTRIYTKA